MLLYKLYKSNNSGFFNKSHNSSFWILLLLVNYNYSIHWGETKSTLTSRFRCLVEGHGGLVKAPSTCVPGAMVFFTWRKKFHRHLIWLTYIIYIYIIVTIIAYIIYVYTHTYIYIYPPTPAICRGSAPEKKWLCGAFGGPAACPMAICRVLSLGLSAACSLAFQQHVLWPPAGRFPWHCLLAACTSRRPRLLLNPFPAPLSFGHRNVRQ